jgi:hypothetical protein
MSDQFSMFDLPTSTDTCSAISSRALEFGPTHCETPDGATAAKSGRDLALVSHSRSEVRGSRLRTSAISFQPGFHLSRHDALSWSLASKLAMATDSLGSTLFDLRWTRRATPSGWSIPALRASARQTSDNDYSSWPTPTKRDYKDGSSDGTVPENALLGRVAWLASWGTPTKQDARHGTLSPSQQNRDPNNLLNQAYLALSMGSGESPNGSGAAMKNGGRLNPALSRWLQGLPPVFCDCAVTAMQSMPKSRRRSSAPTSTCAADAAQPTEPCQDCGEPATRRSADGVPLCAGDYAELCRAAGEEEWP